MESKCVTEWRTKRKRTTPPPVKRAVIAKSPAVKKDTLSFDLSWWADHVETMPSMVFDRTESELESIFSTFDSEDEEEIVPLDMGTKRPLSASPEIQETVQEAYPCVTCKAETNGNSQLCSVCSSKMNRLYMF